MKSNSLNEWVLKKFVDPHEVEDFLTVKGGGASLSLHFVKQNRLDGGFKSREKVKSS